MNRRTYAYPDPLPDNSIRLLKIKHVTTLNGHASESKLDSNALDLALEISIVTLDSGTEYRALSYTWDPQGKEKGVGVMSSCKSVRVDGELHDIDLNLFDALVQLAESYEKSAFWIDAICINQNDLMEKERLVQKMGDVYHNAAEVVIWLGTADQNSHDVIELIYKVAEQDHRVFYSGLDFFTANHLGALGLPIASAPIWRFYLDFYLRRWFERGWVIQEVVLAKEANSLCGPIKTPWNVIMSGSQIFVSENLRKDFFAKFRAITVEEVDGLSLGRNPWRIGRLQEYHQDWGITPALVVEISTGSRDIRFPEYMLLYFVRMSRDFRWHDERDRVYSMIGLVNFLTKTRPVPHLTISPDYSEKTTTAQVLTNFAKIIIEQSNSIGIINLVSDLKYRDRGCYRELPSWVPTFYKAPNFSNSRDQLFHADKHCHSDRRRFQFLGNSLQCWGTQIGYLESVQSVRIDNSPKNIHSLRKIAEQSVHPIGVDRDEVLWRTLIWDIYGHSAPKDWHPASPRLGVSFRNWIGSSTIAVEDTSSTPRTDIGLVDDSEISQLELGKSEKTLNPKNNIQSTKCGMCDPAIFPSHARGVAWEQQLFSLSSGHLGMGPVSGRVGDELWILASCPFPMVLRRSSPDQSSYQALGRAYVHGIMHGEAVSEQSVWETVTLA